MLGQPKAELSVLFVGDRRMRALNARYRGKDRVTDVLSFPLGDSAPGVPLCVLGDIVVCVPQAVRQARAADATLHEEVRRLLIHGLLHLMGYDHEAGPSQERRMRRKERVLLDAL